MFSPARKAAQAVTLHKALEHHANLEPIKIGLPSHCSVEDLYRELANTHTAKNLDVLEHLLILCACLQDSARLSREKGDNTYIQKLSIWISQAILPDSGVIAQSDIASEQAAAVAEAIEIAKHIGCYGLKSLELLEALDASGASTVSPQILLPCVVYSSRDTWVSPETRKLARSRLANHEEQISSREFIVDFLLQTFIRPLFSKSRPATVTSAGRKAMPSSEPPKRFAVDAEKNNKPWKYEQVYAVALLEWAIEKSTEDLIAQSWNLFIPPILTLLDDGSTSIRVRGLALLTTFLPKFSAKLLQQTGLGPVFEDAIHPTLLFLPSLTPIEESLQLLPAAYTALAALCDARFAATGDSERVKFLDKIVRHGILPGYLHSSESLAIIQVLVHELSNVVSRLGVYSVKHLKDILSVLSAILENPFSTLDLLRTSIKTLEIIILNSWPRIGESAHRLVILKSLVICWTNVKSTKDIILSSELVKVGRLFVRVVTKEDEAGIKGQVELLAKADSSLQPLFYS
ncbi:hypothetical protein BJ878DRAFT_104058 [Calycina marina]|uniref:Uncharacterized protein n=1 Tax=Calycina marina TaxID=1763456 RepID=A0A9P7Z1D7_9HELO|nr:hypothetical protein BJ878DRAFT_104058 [Calycina marina]